MSSLMVAVGCIITTFHFYQSGQRGGNRGKLMGMGSMKKTLMHMTVIT